MSERTGIGEAIRGGDNFLKNFDRFFVGLPYWATGRRVVAVGTAVAIYSVVESMTGTVSGISQRDYLQALTASLRTVVAMGATVGYPTLSAVFHPWYGHYRQEFNRESRLGETETALPILPVTPASADPLAAGQILA